MTSPRSSNDDDGALPPTEVSPKATRRRFTAKYKQAILAEADACTKTGELGALLRREGLYSSHLSTWRAQRAGGALQGLAPKGRGPKPAAKNPLDKRVREQQREIVKLRRRFERAEALIEVQKKLPNSGG